MSDAPKPPAAPALPRMTAQERQLWANSHNLPAGMTILYVDELQRLNGGVQEFARVLGAWQRFGLLAFNTADPALAMKRLQDERDGRVEEAKKKFAAGETVVQFEKPAE